MSSPQSSGGVKSPSARLQLQERRRLAMQPRASPAMDTLSAPLPARFENVNDEDEEHGRHADEPLFNKSVLGVFMQARAKPKPEETSESYSDDEQEEAGQQGHAVPQKYTVTHRKKPSDNDSHVNPTRMRSDSQAQEFMSQSQFLPPRETIQDLPERPSSAGAQVHDDASMVERKLQAQAKAEAEMESSTLTLRRNSKDDSETGDKRPLLVPALAKIFNFDEPEDVLAVWSCWYLENMLLQGHLHITTNHICFYAYLRRKGETIKSGTMAKQGKRDPRYTRYWFALKGDVLSYYKDSSQLYFPHGSIDLRFGIEAKLEPEKGKSDKPTPYFTVTTENRKYYFKADSATSAAEWVKQLQTAMFRSHNDGDSVKISLPIQNVIDVEPAPMVDGAETIRICAVDSADDLAMEEYYFTFSNHGGDAFRMLKSLTDNNDARNTTDIADVSADAARSYPERGRDDHPRTSTTGASQPRAASRLPHSPSTHESTDSFATTIDQPLSSPSIDNEEVDMSASQMLTGDGAFRAPTLRMPAPKRTDSESSAERLRQELDEASRSPSVGSDQNSVRRPTHAHTDQTLGDDESAHSRKSGDTVAQQDKAERSKSHDSTATLQRPTRPIATLNSASKVASYVRDQSKRVGSYLSSSPGIYYGKFSGAFAGGRRNYIGSDGLPPDENVKEGEDADIEERNRSFRKHFSLPDSEQLVSSHGGAMYKVLPLWGKIYLGTRYFCYRSPLVLSVKMVIPLKDILNVSKSKAYRFGWYGMVVVIKGHEEMFFEFPNADDRDFCVVGLLRALEDIRGVGGPGYLTEKEANEAETAAAENDLLQQARNGSIVGTEPALQDVTDDDPGILFDDGNASMLDFRPKEPMRVTCLTIGSRGDVQPYIALCKGLLADGHRPKIATHAEFEPWIRKHGIDFAPVGGNPAELMALCVEHGMFTPKFISETNSKFRGWLDELLVSAWEACQDAEVLIESPSAMAGIHISEALGIPYFRAFTMPWTKTRAYPHAFAPLQSKMGGTYNAYTYMVFNNVFWQLTARQINSWRRRTLGIRSTSNNLMKQNEVPFLYNFSPNVVAPPLDFSAWVHITGYWFLDEANDWTPPADLLAFINKARKDDKKLVYIGFGSVVVSDSKAMTQNIVDAVLKADVRCILSKGWSDRLDAKEPNKPEVPLPASIFQIASAPHDWLFKQIDAAVHHGGAGTTGASLRAGIPTIIKPFFGDQFFFSTRVEDIGVGLAIPHITPNALGKALWIATHDARIRSKAAALGERIRSENGVQTAINALYRDLEYAKRLVKRKLGKRLRTPGEKAAEFDDDDGAAFADEDEEEESWTLVDGDADVEATQMGQDIGDPGAWEARARQRRFLGAFGGYAAERTGLSGLGGRLSGSG
ncbi:hypothetical protein Q7P37_006351 [Cladosporium fusiforme]